MTKGVEQARAMINRKNLCPSRLPIAETMKWIMGSSLFSEISIRNSSETGAGPLLYQSLTCSMWCSSVWQVGRHGDAQVTERQVAIRLSLPSIIKMMALGQWSLKETRVYGFTSQLMFPLCTFSYICIVHSPAGRWNRWVAWCLLNIHSSYIGIH